MKTKWIMAAGLAVAMAFTASVQATLITGTVRMSGDVTLDTTSLATANGASSFSAVSVVGSPTGSYVGTAGQSVTWKAFAWNPSTAPVNDLWKFSYLGNDYTFDLGTITSVSQNLSSLLVLGVGTVDISGGAYQTTLANWSFQITDTSGGTGGSFVFGFSDSNTAVPDGGTTVMMLGGALAGLGLLRKKLFVA